MRWYHMHKGEPTWSFTQLYHWQPRGKGITNERSEHQEKKIQERNSQSEEGASTCQALIKFMQMLQGDASVKPKRESASSVCQTQWVWSHLSLHPHPLALLESEKRQRRFGQEFGGIHLRESGRTMRHSQNTVLSSIKGLAGWKIFTLNQVLSFHYYTGLNFHIYAYIQAPAITLNMDFWKFFYVEKSHTIKNWHIGKI